MTGSNAHKTGAARGRTRGQRDDGFSIVELLIAVFIIGLLVSISLVVIAKARRSAQMARVKSDFVAVGMALDQFKADHKALPGMVPVPPGVDSNNALAYCLMSPEDATVDGADGPGFRVQKGAPTTKKWPAYLDSSKFKVVRSPTLPDGTKVNRGTGWELLDAYDMPIVYLPRRKPAVRPDRGLIRGFPNPASIGAYDVLDVNGLLDVLATGDARKGLLMALGDRDANSSIDVGEKANFQGDYVLMSAGPDAAYFTGTKAADFQKADDVYNFDR
jgi:prepilin-type N-terminal cleavage/methylation domain-containing protein